MYIVVYLSRRLDDNPVDCGCKMFWLYKLLHNRNRNIQGAIACHQPRQFQGRSLITLDKNDFQCGKDKYMFLLIMINYRDKFYLIFYDYICCSSYHKI